MSDKTIPVHEGFVRLDGVMADDYSVVNSARVSFAKQSSEIHEDLSGKDKGLITFLMRERHGTPFEHNAFRFHVKCPVFVAREWFRHRIGSFNEFSARYSEVPNEFFVPDESAIRTQIGKPGAYKFEPVDDVLAKSTVEMISAVNEKAYATYAHLVEVGVAKEVARMVLPVSMYTQFYWTVNARSLMNFLSLRTDENAQYEIREFADAVEVLFKEQMPATYSSWIDCGKVCP
jgi:thymidylate synthase (FAD)